MKKPSKTFLLLIFLILVSIGLYFGLMTKKAIQYTYGERVRTVKNCLLYFIDQNQGKFPQGEDELVSQGYLKEEKGVTFLKFPDTGNKEPVWHKGLSFQLFSVHYGMEAEYLILKNKTLYDRRTNSPVLLISGPYRIIVPYKEHSLELYNAMISSNQP